jgi:hypothetical protein
VLVFTADIGHDRPPSQLVVAASLLLALGFRTYQFLCAGSAGRFWLCFGGAIFFAGRSGLWGRRSEISTAPFTFFFKKLEGLLIVPEKLLVWCPAAASSPSYSRQAEWLIRPHVSRSGCRLR